MPEWWKWCPGVVETYCQAVEMGCLGGGNGVPERWKNEKLSIRRLPHAPKSTVTFF
jgi:hypothetical protein